MKSTVGRPIVQRERLISKLKGAGNCELRCSANDRDAFNELTICVCAIDLMCRFVYRTKAILCSRFSGFTDRLTNLNSEILRSIYSFSSRSSSRNDLLGCFTLAYFYKREKHPETFLGNSAAAQDRGRDPV